MTLSFRVSGCCIAGFVSELESSAGKPTVKVAPIQPARVSTFRLDVDFISRFLPTCQRMRPPQQQEKHSEKLAPTIILRSVGESMAGPHNTRLKKSEVAGQLSCGSLIDGRGATAISPTRTSQGDAMNRRSNFLLLLVPALLFHIGVPRAWTQNTEQLRLQIEELTVNLLLDQPREQLSKMLANHAQERLEAANRRSSAEWRQISSRAEWESFKSKRLEALRTSLGQFPDIPRDPRRRVTRILPGEGFVIENLVFESRPGMWVTANLYRPEPLRQSPSILADLSPRPPIRSLWAPKTRSITQAAAIGNQRATCVSPAVTGSCRGPSWAACPASSYLCS